MALIDDSNGPRQSKPITPAPITPAPMPTQQTWLHTSTSVSYVWPDLLEAGMFYASQTLAQFANGEAAYIDPNGCPMLGTSPLGIFDYKNKGTAVGGAQRKDLGWLQARGEQFKTWHTTATYIYNIGSQVVKEFDFHVDGIRDCLYMLDARQQASGAEEQTC